MIEIDVPGDTCYRIAHIVCDYNGTLAADGTLLPGVADAVVALAQHVTIHVLTADTFGTAAAALSGRPVQLTVLQSGPQDQSKRDYVLELGAESTAAVGNGRNDLLMIRESVLGICVLQREGACRETLAEADIVCSSPVDALQLFSSPKRLIATLRK